MDESLGHKQFLYAIIIFRYQIEKKHIIVTAQYCNE